MNKNKEKFDHLINNLERNSLKYSIFNYESGRRAFLLLGQGNLRRWLESLLPNTRLILEPKIIGSSIAIQYIQGKLNKAINENCRDITKEVKSLGIIPKSIPIMKTLEIQGILYKKNRSNTNKKPELKNIQKSSSDINGFNFCTFQIFHCKLNHYKALQELKKLNFEIPETQFTKYISDVEIYYQCWKKGHLFQSYPTSGIVLKINSRKLQKHLGQNNLSINWAYSIK